MSKNKHPKIIIHNPISLTKLTEVYESYWRFAALRQEVFFNKLKGHDFPWTEDPIISKYKFTNTYRASDRVSQYLIKNVIYNKDYSTEPKEVLFRILLFKLFNKIDTWKLLKANIGILSYEEFNFKTYDKILSQALAEKKTIYSAAYIMPSGKPFFGKERKHSNHLKLIQYMLDNDFTSRIMEAKKMQDAFEIIKAFPSLGYFLAYQLLIDINYSEIINFSESEFVVAGPGAKGGISKCFSDTAGLNEVEIIKLMTDNQEKEFERLEINFKDLWGRRLQLIDCQNIFCEVDKYARVRHPEVKGNSDRSRIKQSYKINHEPINYWFPPKWGINDNIN